MMIKPYLVKNNMEKSEQSLDSYLDKSETVIASTSIYDRNSRLVPYKKTKSSLLLSNKYLYIDEFNLLNENEIRSIFKFNYPDALKNGFQFFESFDRNSDYIVSGKSTIKFQFLNQYNEFVYNNTFPRGGYTEVTKAGNKFIELFSDKEFIIEKKLTIDEIFYENLKLLIK